MKKVLMSSFRSLLEGAAMTMASVDGAVKVMGEIRASTVLCGGESVPIGLNAEEEEGLG